MVAGMAVYGSYMLGRTVLPWEGGMIVKVFGTSTLASGWD